MAAKTKKLCKWKKGEYEKSFDTLSAVVAKPVYACRRCGRAASAKKWLCKPAKLQPGAGG
jgi:hypothetical protein